MIAARRQGETLAATLRPRLRFALAWVIGGAAALFVANLSGGRAVPVVAAVLAALWLWLVLDGLVQGWRWRTAGLPALLPAALPFVAIPFAAFAANHALYWSHVAPSWWLLRSERAAFDAALRRGAPPAGVPAIERSGARTAFATRADRRTAIVHDPSGRLATARGWNGGPVGRDVRRAFRGGDIIWCQRLDSRWFHCQFG